MPTMPPHLLSSDPQTIPAHIEHSATQDSALTTSMDAKTDDVVNTGTNLADTVVGIVKEVGELLNTVPYVKSLSGIVLQIVKIRNELKSNKERCQEIIDKVLRITNSVYERLSDVANSKGKANLTRLEGHLGECNKTLSAVYAVLEKHRTRRRITRLINRGLDELNALDRRIDELNIKHIIDIVTDIKLQQALSLTGDDDQAARFNGSSISFPDHVLPPRPELLIEREAQLDIALGILLRAESSRIAILGAGGFGKTALARAIMHDPKVIDRYEARYFLSCEGISDADNLLMGLGSMLGIKAVLSATLASARRILEKSATLLCLDNFETPWEPSANRTKVESLLDSIADIPNVSLIITMRGTQRPSKVIWSQPLLPPLTTLSSDSASLILHTISPNHTVDKYTEKLLDGIEGIPLAITLISSLLRDGETSQALWTRWAKEHTNIIETGGEDRESNLNASIALSIHSPRMTKEPGAKLLLAALSLLPDGLPWSQIERIEEHLGIDNINKVLQTLRCVALTKSEESIHSLRTQMLSPIRLFCHEFLSSEISLVLDKVVNHYIALMIDIGDNISDVGSYIQIVPEIQNIHSVFQRGYRAGYSQDVTKFLDATVILIMWSYYVGYQAQETLQIALERSSNLPIPYAKFLISLGTLYQSDHNHKKAEECFREAVDLFRRSNNAMGESRALLRLGDLLCSVRRYEEGEIAFKTSLEVCIPSDILGKANAFFCYGQMYITKHQRVEAEICLASALQAYKQLPDFIGQANVTHCLSQLQMERGNLTEAERFITESLTASKQAKYSVGEGNALALLGHVYRLMDRVTDARQALEQALAILKKHNSHISLLNTVLELGHVLIQLDQLSSAKDLIIPADTKWDIIQSPTILITLGWLYICSDRYDTAERYLIQAIGLFQQQGNKARHAEALVHLATIYLKSNRLEDAAEALNTIPDLDIWGYTKSLWLWVLGDLRIIEGRFDDAEVLLDAAISRFRQIGYSFQQANVLRSIATLHAKRGNVELAIKNFKAARELHRKALWVSEQVIDLKELSQAYDKFGMSEQAEESLEEAEVLAETVRKHRNLL